MNEKDLAAALRQGSETAVALAMNRYARLLWSTAARALGELAAPEEIGRAHV